MKKLITFIAFVFVACSANAQSCPDDNHPHAIDLGLPSGTKWACCNVGASIPEGSGGYYAWGETKEKEIYDWTTYIHCDGSMETCHDLGSDIAGSEYDVAHVQWGGFWVMPTQEQIQELTSNCSCTWTRRNGVDGDLFTGPNGFTVFLPESDFWRKGRDKGGIDVFNGGNRRVTLCRLLLVVHTKPIQLKLLQQLPSHQLRQSILGPLQLPQHRSHSSPGRQ